ncbi:PP2C family protein-serine/threonine phosphatase [Streptacidiphilus monticola]|jgi:hypothetical protein|uniref:PP2C family protein-serine/threonine phosphatase n=1 Tax=Streptacidiphilus monticola TaxID=2161674 RepID=A0ABW1FXD4_9ACTN
MTPEPFPIGPGEQLLEEFFTSGRTLDPAETPVLAQRYTSALGLGDSRVLLADIQQHELMPLDGGPGLPVEGSPAGWAYRTGSLRVVEDGPELCAWFPLVDGAERLGLLELRTSALTSQTLHRCRMLAGVLAPAITSMRDSSDSYAQGTRAERMSLPSEMLRAFLPPRTIATHRVVSTAVLEPAYDLGGDAFEHALTDGALHAAILDAMGHDLGSGLTAALALGACRNARRNGADLPDLVATIDDALTRWFPDRFATGVFLRVDTGTGTLHWANCGHPPPLLIRDRKVIPDALERPAEPPLGLTGIHHQGRTVHSASLRPGDTVLLYTDGVVEARGRNRDGFGLDRFADFIIRTTAAGEPAPEALRRLIHALLDYQAAPLEDDCTIMMIEWRPA